MKIITLRIKSPFPLNCLTEEFVLKRKNREEQAFFDIAWNMAFPDRIPARAFKGERHDNRRGD